MQNTLIYFLLIHLREKPGMFLTGYSLSCLNIFLTGVETTCWKLDKEGLYAGTFFGDKGFLQWSWKKYHLGTPPARINHYLEFAGGDEALALDLFFDDLHTFYGET